ncbi:energy-coupling factor ABC transporter ATP-binding protein [Martelella sp. FOR1707]
MKIEFTEAGVRFEGRMALHPLTLTLNEHRIGIIGLNGSGKTTFARLINGLTKPTTGAVAVNGRDTVTDTQAVMADAGFVFQSPQNQIILPILQDDIELGLKARGVAKAEVPERAQEALARLGIARLARRRAHELSGGELQLAALAAVLATRPSLVILDEPTNQLDLQNRRRVAETIAALDEDVIIISHDLAILENFERVLLFHEGRLVGDGQPHDVIAQYEAMNR